MQSSVGVESYRDAEQPTFCDCDAFRNQMSVSSRLVLHMAPEYKGLYLFQASRDVQHLEVLK